MKRFLHIFFLLGLIIICLAAFSACGGDDSDTTTTTATVTTTAPATTAPHVHTPIIDSAVAPTCVNTGLTEGSHCSVCQVVLVEQETVAALGHDEIAHGAKAPTCTAIGYDAYVTCSRCDYTTYAEKAALGHNEIAHGAKAPTCTAIGYDAYVTCSRCDYTTYEEKAALGHTSVTDAAVAPDCTNTGLTAGSHCSVCSTVLVAQTTVPALGHTSVTDAAVAPTCTATGLTEGSHCSVCSTVLVAQTTVDALGHTSVTDAAVPPTCTATGLTAGSHCSVCSTVLVAQTTVPATGHTSVTDAAVPPTCTATGLTEGSHCSVCSTVLVAQTTVPANGHTDEVIPAVAPTCTSTGLTVGKKCSVCNEILVAQTTVDALGHTPATDAAVPPTCTATGLTAGSHCSVCSTVLVAQTTVPANGHTDEDTDYTCDVCDTELCINHSEENIPAVAPTCTQTGLTEGKKCSICKEILVAQEVVDALGHDEIDHEAKAPTCTETGYDAYVTCSRCDYTTYEEKAALGHTSVTDEAVAPTCTDTGLTEGSHCSVCQAVLVAQTTVPANGHTDEVIPAVAPTCTSTGLTVGKKCSVCNEILVAQTTVDALGHTPVTDAAVPPTCTATGLTEGSHCSVCSTVLVAQTTVPANGHAHEATVTPPTCTEEGYTTYTCHCGDTYIADAILALGHTYAADWEQSATHHWHAAICGHESEISDHGEHDYGTDYVCDTCGYDSEIYAKEVTLNVNNLTVFVGDSQTLTATVSPDDTANKSITWSSSDSLVITVDSEGRVEAKAPGLAVIVATTENGKTATCTVIVQAAIVEASGVELSHTEIELSAGDTATLNANVLPETTTNRTLTWITTDENVVTVYNGELVAVAPGTATVTVTTANGKSASCTVTVTAAQNPTDGVTGISLNRRNLLLDEGDEIRLYATLSGTSTGRAEILWGSSDHSIVKVSADGTITAISVGTAYVTAIVNGTTFKATCFIAVESVNGGTPTLSRWESDPRLSILPEPDFGSCTGITSGGATYVEVTRREALAYIDELETLGYSFTSTANTSYVYSGTATKGGYTVSIGWTLSGYNFSVLVQGGSGNGSSGSSVSVSRVSIDKTNIALLVGQSATIGAVAMPNTATDRALSWSSSNTSVAVISNGIITAVGKGTAMITATAGNGKKATCTVTVTRVADEVVLDKAELTLEKGSTETLGATILPEDADDKSLTWTSSDNRVAIVQSGKITAIGKGTATITVTTANGKTATCTVTVVITVTGVTLDKTAHNMAVGDEIDLLATVTPGDATDPTITWESSDIGVLTVDENGKVKALSAGTATVTVTTANGKTAICTFTVASVAINLDKTTLQLLEGNAEALTVTFTPSYTANQNVIWHTSDSTIATVENGVVTAHKSGTVTITAEAVASGSSASCTVTVVPYEIYFATLVEKDGVLYGEVSNATTSFAFKSEVTLKGDAVYVVSKDEFGYDTVIAKAIPLNVGDNHIYIVVAVDDETFAFPIVIRRRPMYQVTFMPENGTESIKVRVEEDSCVTPPEVVRLGHTLRGWGYDFEVPVTEAMTLVADWSPNPEMSDFTFIADATTCTVTGVLDKTKAEYSLPSYVTAIGEGAFSGCSELTRISLSASLQSIGADAFADCDKLVEVCNPSALSITAGANTYGGIASHALHVYTDPTEASIVTFDPDGFIFVRNGDALLLTGYTGTAASVTLPASCNGSSYALAEGAFAQNKHLVSVTVGNGVTHIAPDAFRGCEGLQSISIADTVTSIGASAFRDCSALRLLSLGKGITEIGGEAFSGCTSLATVNLADIGAWCGISFADETSSPFVGGAALYVGGLPMTELSLPDSVTAISPYAFYGCASLTSATLGNAVASIGESAFGECIGLTTLVLPDSITSIGIGAFYGCSSLSSVTFGAGAAAVGEYAFAACTNLTELILPEGAKSIGYGAFAYCSGFTALVLPDSVDSIAEDAFYGCTSLKMLVIGNGVTSLPKGLLYGCSSLESLTIPFVGGSKAATSASSSTLLGYIFGSSSYDGGVKTTQHCSSSGYATYYIPASLKSVTVTGGKLFYGAFYNCDIITVVLGDDVTSIGSYAFFACGGLTSVVIGDSVKSIGSYAFDYCDGLTSVVIPDNVTSIGSSAFRSCTSLISVVIPDSVTSIGDSAFSGCASLTSVVIPDSVTSIGLWAFENCSSLTIYCEAASKPSGWHGGWNYSSRPVVWGITGHGTTEDRFKWISKGNVVTVIDYTGSATDITIPESINGMAVTSIVEDAFEYCSSLTSVVIPDSVTSIGERAFEYCSSLTIYCEATSKPSGWNSNWKPSSRPVVWGYTGTNGVNEGGFKWATTNNGIAIGGYTGSATDITIPESINGMVVTSIVEDAFYDCSSLTSVVIPDSVTSIGSSAFSRCTGLTGVYISDIAAWCSISLGSSSGNPLSYAKNLYLNGELVTNLVIPEGVTSIGEWAFYGCSSLTSVVIGDSVTSIGWYAFKNCTSLTSVEIGDSVTSIGTSAFSGCSSLKSLTIPFVGGSKTATSASSSTFFGYIFGSSSYDGGVRTQQYHNAFSDSITYYIPATLKSVTVTGGKLLDGAFSFCSSLTSVEIPDSVKSIGRYAFYGCSALTSVVIPDSVTSIGDDAFSGCSSLTSVVIGDSVTSIGDAAFSGCSSLTSVVIGDSVTSIGWYAFENCSSLTSVVIPDSVTSIGEYAFSGCSSLKSLTIPFVGGSKTATSASSSTLFGYIFGSSSYDGGVRTEQYYESGSGCVYYIPASLKSVTVTGGNIRYGAFSWCAKLTSVVIGDSVKSIGQYAFKNCSSLTSVVIPDSVTSIGDYAFFCCTSLTIYCEASSKPSGWERDWNFSSRPVVWGYKGS